MPATRMNGTTGATATYRHMGQFDSGCTCASDCNVEERIEAIKQSRVLAIPVPTWLIIGSKVR